MIDLHLHSTCSDGKKRPEDIVRAAHVLRLRAVSITDHDTMAGSARAANVAQDQVAVVPGVELSAIQGKSPIHILGYGADAANVSFASLMEAIREDRRRRALAIVRRLHALGLFLPMDRVEGVAGDASITRAHVAEALAAEGIVPTYGEAFRTYLADGCPAYIPHGTLSPGEAIEHIHNAGGVAVLAHPGVTRRDELIAGMVRFGLDGIEIVHPNHTPAAVRFYRGLATKYHLLMTGGSDGHGTGRGADRMGLVTAPLRLLDPLLGAISLRRSHVPSAPFEESHSSVS